VVSFGTEYNEKVVVAISFAHTPSIYSGAYWWVYVPIASKDNMMKPCHPYINQSTQQREKARNKMEGPSYKKTNEPPQEGKSQREHQVPKPPLVVRSISKKERKG
jgi:hypothetical protein